ncbi:MAG: terminase family protein [Pseudomonadota bacterium]
MPPLVADWRNWLFLGGRGAGKTRAGAEWIRFAVTYAGFSRVALVGPTLGDVREVMIEGESGLRAIEPIDEWRPKYNVSRRRLEWENGACAQVFSAEDPDSLRGPQFELAWCDEVAAWARAEATWDTLQMGLRLGDGPRCIATTTPKPVPLIKRLAAGEAVVTHAATADNSAYLATGFMDHMNRTYSGTALGRQELQGELMEDPEGALWTRSIIDAARSLKAPERFDDIIVAIDPPATSHLNSDACGIVAAGRCEATGFGRKCFVLSDASAKGLRPLDWGARAVALAKEVGASAIVAEANQGGEMIASVLASAGCELPVRLVHAKLGKRARAQPVAALYSCGEVSHVGCFEALEDEMCRFGAAGFTSSPDRLDALVWAVASLMLETNSQPRVRGI